MSFLTYHDTVLHIERVSLNHIEESIGTPFYVYSSSVLEKNARRMQACFKGTRTHMAYAVKANSNLSVLMSLAALGFGADIVSGGELFRALKAGFPPSHMTFSGVGKTPQEHEAALKAGIRQINVESEGEMRRLAALAAELNIKAPVALRVNPEIKAGGHAYIETGGQGSKFGMPWEDAERLCAWAVQHDHLDFRGLHVHLGSQIETLAPFEAMARQLSFLTSRLRRQGIPVHSLDIGGGLGIAYQDSSSPPAPEAYAEAMLRILGPLNVELIIEPGRVIIGEAGLLVTRVLDMKETPAGCFAVLDAGMNDFLRPALYGACHDVLTLKEPSFEEEQKTYHLVGPVCESADVFLRDVSLPGLEVGACLAFLKTGAYGAVLSSSYNSRPLIPEVFVKGQRWTQIRRRPSYEEMLGSETPAPWLLLQDKTDRV